MPIGNQIDGNCLILLEKNWNKFAQKVRPYSASIYCCREQIKYSHMFMHFILFVEGNTHSMSINMCFLCELT